MKLRTQERNLSVGGVQQVVEYGISLGPELMDILSGLYSDVPWAIVREYVTNARDGHVKLEAMGKTPPQNITVHVPSVFEPHFTVRDYGVGMTPDVVMSVYNTYGLSTKNDNNDEVGGLGLGAKSGFAYYGSDQFTIVSFHEGKAYTYLAARDSRHMPTLTHMTTTDTEEPNGVLVKVPVSRQDYQSFRAAIMKLARRFDYPLTITGDAEGVTKGNYAPYEYTHKDEFAGWRPPRSGEDGLYAVMGGVPYPVDLYNKDLGLDYDTRSVFTGQGSADLLFNVGDLDIVPSREGLKYTPHTVTALKARMLQVKKVLQAAVLDKVKDCKTVWEARNLIQTFSGTFNRAGLGGDTALWDNYTYYDLHSQNTPLPVDDIFDKLKDFPDLRIVGMSQASRGVSRHRDLHPLDPNSPTKHREKKVYLVPPGTENSGGRTVATNLFVADLARGGIGKFKQLVENAPDQAGRTQYLVYSKTTPVTKKDLVGIFHGYPLRSLTEEYKALGLSKGAVAQTTPTTPPVYLPTAHKWYAPHAAWEIDRYVKVAGSPCLWIPLLKGEPDWEEIGIKPLTHFGINALMSVLASLGWKEVYGVTRPVKGIVDSHPDWTSISTILPELKTKVKNYPYYTAANEHDIANKVQNIPLYHLAKGNSKTCTYFKLPDSHAFVTYFNKVKKLSSSVKISDVKLDRQYTLLAECLGIDLSGKKPRLCVEDFEKEYTDLQAQYPLVTVLELLYDSYGYQRGKPDKVNTVLEGVGQYMKLMDKEKTTTVAP